MSDRRAAVDIGTNSVRLLVRHGDTDVERRAVITRLGGGVDRTGRLADDAIDRTLAALRGFRDTLDGLGIPTPTVVATSAARDAANREDFFTAAEAVLGVRPALLPGDQEARLSFRGAVAGLDRVAAPFLVVDVGGGSTEFAVGETDAVATRSIGIGCVRLTEMELLHDPPRPDELTNALGVVQDAVEDVIRAMPDAAGATLVGVGGTITTMTAVEIGLPTYDRSRVDGFRLTRDAAEDVFRTLATESLPDRKHNPGLQPGRADIIVGGCCIVIGLMRALHSSELIVRDADLLDALVDAES